MKKDYKIVFIYCTVKFLESCNILLIISNYFQNIIDPNSYKFNVMQLFKYIDQILFFPTNFSHERNKCN